MRSYKKPVAQEAPKTFFICPVRKCNKKYKKKEKLKDHVETVHYYETRNRVGSFSLSQEQKIKIYTLAKDYAKLLYGFSEYPAETLTEELKQSSTNLLPQYWCSSVEQKEIERISHAQLVFAKNFFSLDLSSCDWEKVMTDLTDFFALGLPYYDTNFCPSIFIDFLWHACMQDRVFYTEICAKAVGELIPHCIEREEDLENKRFSYFLEIFSKRYGRSPYNPMANENPENVKTPLEKIIDGLDKPIREFQRQEEEKKKADELKKEILSAIAKEIGCEVPSYHEYDYCNIYKRGYRGKDIQKIFEEEMRISYANMRTGGSC